MKDWYQYYDQLLQQTLVERFGSLSPDILNTVNLAPVPASRGGRFP